MKLRGDRTPDRDPRCSKRRGCLRGPIVVPRVGAAPGAIILMPMNPNTPRILTAQDLLRGVPTVSGPVRGNKRLGHPLPASGCECLRAPIPDMDGCVKCGRRLESNAA